MGGQSLGVGLDVGKHAMFVQRTRKGLLMNFTLKDNSLPLIYGLSSMI